MVLVLESLNEDSGNLVWLGYVGLLDGIILLDKTQQLDGWE